MGHLGLVSQGKPVVLHDDGTARMASFDDLPPLSHMTLLKLALRGALEVFPTSGSTLQPGAGLATPSAYPYPASFKELSEAFRDGYILVVSTAVLRSGSMLSCGGC